MEYEINPLRRDRYVYESILDFEQANRSPIYGYENEQILPLEEAVRPILFLLNNNLNYINTAKEKCNRQSTDLTWDQSAAIYLYTMSTPLFTHLNRFLRDENRHALKPWFPFLKLLISGLQKLSSSEVRVWRGVSSHLGSFSTNEVKTWWSVNSTSKDINVVEHYVIDGGTLFLIEAIDGKIISEYSSFPEENEVILLPGTRLRISAEPVHFLDRLLIVHLIEEQPLENTTRDDIDIYDETDLNDELFPLVNENPYELPHYQVDRIRRCFPNVNILLTITIGIGLLTVAIISFFILSQKLRSTSSTDFHIIDELSSTYDSTYCFPIGWNSTGNIIARGGWYSALAIDDYFNVYVVNQDLKSLDIWSTYGQLISRLFERNFDTASPLFFHSPSQSLYFAYTWHRESSIFKLHINSTKPVQVINDTMLNANGWVIGSRCGGIYVNAINEIFVFFTYNGKLMKWTVNETRGILVADGHRYDSTTTTSDNFQQAVIDERNHLIYILDGIGPRLLKYINGSLIGTAVFDPIEKEIFSNVKFEYLNFHSIIVDQTGYFLLGESYKISMWTSDGKFNVTVIQNYYTVEDKIVRTITKPTIMTFDKLGNLYVIDQNRVIRFNRTSIRCLD